MSDTRGSHRGSGEREPSHRSAGDREGRHRGTRRRTAAPTPLRRLLPRTLVVAVVAGGTSAFVVQDKGVTLDVDGSRRTLHTYADDVGDLLARQGVELGAHDTVTPAPGRPLRGGQEIEVRRGRPLSLTVDGEHRRVWTTARTVGEALRDLGVRTTGAWLSHPAGAAVPRAGLALDVRTERNLTVLADGRRHHVRTDAATVREAVAQAGPVLRGLDTTSVPPGGFPREGQTVTVLRVTRHVGHRDLPVPFHTLRRTDPSAPRGTEVVERPGSPGVRRVTYAVRTVNGVPQRPRTPATETLRRPVDRIVAVGTRRPPSAVPGADGLDWDAMARCESGGRPDAVDPSGTYGGLYQLDTRTWRQLGGRGRPQDAPPAEQTYRAKRLYVTRGAAPRPHCGRKLHQ
ncbi:ubiquitin-like domain-containing protein [Streptomyces sp. NPDC018031]|uniref:ubiquitin-like domain-containing protein n=1 Tax=Streptomyces sp. NPDC018031 TaxID=3365033 RepID=UPI0037B78934